MTPTTTGWVVFIAALGVMLGLSAADVARLETWDKATTPAFVGLFMMHISAVIGAFVGGKLIPTQRDPDLRTRDSDRNPPPPAPQQTVVVVPSQESKP